MCRRKRKQKSVISIQRTGIYLVICDPTNIGHLDFQSGLAPRFQQRWIKRRNKDDKRQSHRIMHSRYIDPMQTNLSSYFIDDDDREC